MQSRSLKPGSGQSGTSAAQRMQGSLVRSDHYLPRLLMLFSMAVLVLLAAVSPLAPGPPSLACIIGLDVRQHAGMHMA